MAEPIRLLLAIGSMSGGGAERQLLRILDHLDQSKFVPVLYLVNAEGELLAEIPDEMPVVSFSEQFRPSRFNFPGRIHRLQVRHLASVLRELEIDVVYDRTHFVTVIAAPACRRVRVPRISVIDCEPRRDLEANARRFMSVKRRLLRRAYATADCTIAVSDGVRRSAIDYYGLPPDRVVTMVNFIDLDRMAQEPLDDWEADRFHIVACGRLHTQKGFGPLLAAVTDLVHRRKRSRALLHILGDGPLADELQRRIDAADLGGHVRLHGFVANPYPFFHRAQLFCLSSLYEGFGLVLAEAMACRTPVLSTDCPSGPSEILQDGRYGRLVPVANTTALADAIEDAMEDYTSWASVTESARRHVEREYSPSARVGELEDMLTSVCRRPA